MRIHALILPFAFVALSIVLSGCAASRQSGWDAPPSTTEASSQEAKALFTQAMTPWKTRHEKPSLEQALKLLEQSAAEDPSSLDTLIHLTRGHYLMADAHAEDNEAKKASFDLATRWGERALATNEAFKKKVKDEARNVEEALDTLTTREVPAMYWTAASLGKWARLSGLGTMLKYKNRIKMLVERVEVLDPQYFHGAVPRYWGTYYAVAPGFAGGDINKSLQHYQKSLKLENNYFGTHVLYAENYATRKNDRELFKKELEFVINGKPESMPELLPEQIIEQRKAKKMMAQIEDLF